MERKLLRRLGPKQPRGNNPEGPAPWPLTSSERELAGYIAAGFHLIVRTVAAELFDAGVPLDPEWDGDQAVLAVILLLPKLGYLIPWDGKIDEFAEVLQPPGVSAFTPDGRSASARDGRPDGMARNADRIRKLIRADNGGRELHVPYARGTGRALPRATEIRREILAEILADNPAVTASDILRTYDYSDRTPGGRLRHQLRQRLEAEGCPVLGKPSQTTLYDDFGYLSGASVAGTEKDSGRSILGDVGTPAGPREGISSMSKTSSPALPEPGRLHGGIAPLAMVITTNLASAHSTGQYLAGLAALALALAYDVLIHRRQATDA